MQRRGPRAYRKWDHLLPAGMAAVVRARRKDPDGKRHDVGTRTVGGRECNSYPWAKMADGDFFIAPIKSSREALYTQFRQTASKYNIEIVVVDWDLNGLPALRVTRIMDGVNELKDREGLAIFDHKKKNKRTAQYRKSSRANSPQPIRTIREEEVEEPAPPAAEEPPTDDYAEELKEKRRQAKLSALLGLEGDEL